MTTERDPGTRLVLSWLREDAHENAERVLLRALDVVDATPQRRAWWPARRTLMPTYAKLVAAAAALVVVTVVGYNLLPRSGVGGPPPSPTPAATLPALPSDDAVGLAAGTYVTGAPFPVRVAATVPAGWHGHVPGPYYGDLWKQGEPGGIYFLILSQLSANPCDSSKGWVDIPGATVDDLTHALQAMPSIAVSNVKSATVGGYSGTAFDLTAAANISSCKLTADGYVIWKNALNGASPALAGGERLRVWILDVAGQRLVIAIQDANNSPATVTETQAIFDSIQISPGT